MSEHADTLPEKGIISFRLIPLAEACQLFGGISKVTAYRGTRAGRFPPIRAAMGRAAVRADELETFLKAAPLGAQRRK